MALLEAQEQSVSKLLIYACKETSPQEPEGDPFTVQYNPSEYSRKLEVEWEESEADGNSDGVQKFKRIKPSDLSINFILDGTGVSGSDKTVEERIDELLNKAYNYQGEKHKPHNLFVSWGTLKFYGVLQSINISYSLFSPDGNPLRAKVDLSLTSHKNRVDQVAETKPASPDMTHMRVIKDGDHLPLISHSIYGDSKYYLEVARANEVTNFRKLKTGTKIYFPPLKEEEDDE